MSCEKALEFLIEISHKEELRTHFINVTNSAEFITKCQELGYDFTHEELKTVIKDHSLGVKIRRESGVWVWLRQINWI